MMHKFKLGDKVSSPHFPNENLIVNGIRADEVEVMTKKGIKQWLYLIDVLPSLTINSLEVGKLYILDKRYSLPSKVELVSIIGNHFCSVKSSESEVLWDVMKYRLSEIEDS